jgi:hypothetical protein
VNGIPIQKYKSFNHLTEGIHKLIRCGAHAAADLEMATQWLKGKKRKKEDWREKKAI